MSTKKVKHLHVSNPPSHGDLLVFANNERWFVVKPMLKFELRRVMNDWTTTHPIVRDIDDIYELMNAVFELDSQIQDLDNAGVCPHTHAGKCDYWLKCYKCNKCDNECRCIQGFVFQL